MRILKLYANQPTFKAVKFNRTGLSLILGKRADTESSNSRKTYNGVGKSLSIALIDFCLGSKTNKALKKHLPGWVFFLDVEFGEQKHVLSRAADGNQQLFIDGSKKTQTAFKEWLAEKAFNISSPLPYLKFRSLIRQFLRPGKESYLGYMTLSRKETDFQNVLRVSFLLGLDTERVNEKFQLKKQFDDISND